MGDSAHTTHHTTPGVTLCSQKCVSKYLHNAKKLFGNSIDLPVLVYCGFAEAPLVVTQKLPVSTLPKVESRPEFAQDHESGLRSDREPVVLCDFSKLLFWKSPYEFLNLYGRFCPYNPPYNPGRDTLSPKMRIEIFTQRKKTRRKSIGFLKAYRLSSRNRAWKFPSVRKFGDNGSTKTTLHL